MNDAQRENARNVCAMIEPLRVIVGKPITITSGYRCPQLNKIVKGSRTSQHMQGAAMDFRCDGMTVEQLFQSAKILPFDQLIQEYGGWVHVSWSEHPRREVWRYEMVNGKTKKTRESVTS